MDKYIWSVRLSKTRSQATELVSKGKVRVNDEACKPARNLKIGDEITIIKHTAHFRFKILNLLDRRVGAKLVQEYILDITPEEERVRFKEFLENQQAYRDFGEGKPTKKQRRDLDDFLESW